ncbi:ABC transporter substrate-binding protein [Desulfosarcina variabilis]|uniref:ABC transporter substrate-binding protein n=1 Tax=Desulfosarcina variabilis TaxID=2300 RepID=UPI003AFA15D2
MRTVVVTALCCILMEFLLLIGGRQAAVAADKAAALRTVTDLQGNTVKLPPPKDLQRVVIVAPPLVSTFAALRIENTKIVGTHKVAFADANNQLLDLLLPGWKGIPTGFLTGFQSNAEELLKLEPDAILVYGKFQREGLQGLPVPVLDFYIDNQDNEVWSVAIETLMREIFTASGGTLSLQKEWDQAKKKATALLSNRKGPKKKGLMIMSNTGDKVTVRGIGSYGDDWLNKSGLVNAADIKGDNREVSMEQLLAWNPDVIYVFRGIPASRYLNGSIPGQNWHPITAVRKGAVHDMPLGLMNWGAPHADSPLTLLWLIAKNYPDLISRAEFKKEMRAYYSRRYNITLSDHLMQSILHPHAK